MKSDVLEQLVPYYQRELDYLREMGGAFAAAYPKVAARLEMSGSESPDPHVERLIESFALLTARIQHNIDGEFPEITTALLDVLFPQFMRPVPSMAIAHFDVDPEQGKLTEGFDLKRHTPLFTQAAAGELCRFRTCYPTTLWPFRITEAAFEPAAKFNFLDSAGRVATVLRLRMISEAGPFEDFDAGSLRIHLAGSRSVTTRLYELLFGHTYKLGVVSPQTAYPTLLPSDAVQPVGFKEEQGMLPYPPNAHFGYRLIQEYFTFPDQFLFAELRGLGRHLSGSMVDLLFLLDSSPDKEMAISPGNFLLNCAPLVNLFPKTSAPIRWDHRKTEYRLVPDPRRERTTEIYSIDSMSASSAREDETRFVQPYFSFDHRLDARKQTVFWHNRRIPSRQSDRPGTDMEVIFTDLAFRPEEPAETVMYAHLLCTNRHLPTALREGTVLDIEVSAPTKEIYLVQKPSAPVDPPLGGDALWRVISHLSLNQLSLGSEAQGLTALREILRLYSNFGRRDVDLQINGIRAMDAKPVVRRMGIDAWRGFCSGTEIDLLFDEQNYTGGQAFLLASVLNHFFALYTSVNSFTQLVARSMQRTGEWKRWNPMAGEQAIL